MPIKVLDPQVAAKIAAGEVVERPASVVKELLDNAIDAAATQIKIEVRGGGVELIRVVDNGYGIPAAELPLAFARHATSKIATVDDLLAVRTLGFRGEALASIAAVAQVTLVSHPANQPAGAFVRLEGGQIVQQGSRGAPPGTTVTVEHLFSTVPARRKFLKSPATETTHITNLVCQYALAYPALRFTLVNDGRLVFQSTGSGHLLDALIAVYGLETAHGMIEVQAQEIDRGEPSTPLPPQVSGYISQPALTRASRAYLSFFVNHRWVQSRVLSYAVEEAYHTLLQVGRHPIAVLNIELPPEQLDVNVHPAKTEVRFLREREVFAAVQRAVRSALAEQAGIPLVSRPIASGEAEEQRPGRWAPVPPAERGTLQERQTAMRLFQGVAVAPQARDEGRGTRDEGRGTEEAGGKTQDEGLRTEDRGLRTEERVLMPLRLLGQLAQTYIIAEAPEGLYLIDQHAAHERIIYERLMTERQRLAVSAQMLLEPLTVELTPRQQAAAQARLPLLADWGFALEPFGERTYLVRAVPAVLRRANLTEVLIEILDQLADDSTTPDQWQEQLLITITCHSAVRAGQPLTVEEMRELLEQLEKTTLPRTCPHGRPTMLLLSQTQLEREFGRR
jgi:DNA mismatch repair protein MutL